MGKELGGSLAVARAFGDNGLFSEFPKSGESLEKSKGNSHLPTIGRLELSKQLDFSIIACDGLWNIYSSVRAVTVIKNFLDAEIHPQVR